MNRLPVFFWGLALHTREWRHGKSNQPVWLQSQKLHVNEPQRWSLAPRWRDQSEEIRSMWTTGGEMWIFRGISCGISCDFEWVKAWYIWQVGCFKVMAYPPDASCFGTYFPMCFLVTKNHQTGGIFLGGLTTPFLALDEFTLWIFFGSETNRRPSLFQTSDNGGAWRLLVNWYQKKKIYPLVI